MRTSMVSEFRHGSIVPTILATPDRRRVFAAKALVGAGAGALVALLALAVSLGVGAAVLASTGAAPTWSATGLLLHAGRFAAAGALWAAIGVGIGALVRHQVAAIVGSLVWLLVGENMLLGAFPGAGRFLPGTAGAAALGLQTGRVSITMLAALGVLAAWAAGSAVVGATALRARDVT